MATLSIRLPDSVHKNVKLWAEKEGVSINQFLSSAAAEKLAALATEDYINQQAARASRSAFEAALNEAPDVAEQFDAAT